MNHELGEGWEFRRGDLGGIWEALRPVPEGGPEAVPPWEAVSLPHCWNALDAVDPDGPYYQGPGWYRRVLPIANPFPEGRTLLRFEGAGPKTRVWVGSVEVGSHLGGYDAWELDITEHTSPSPVVLSVRCDNSRDLESIPSDLSDFTIYGGLYRPVSLVYQPALAVTELGVKPRKSSSTGQWFVDLKVGLTGVVPPEATLDLLVKDSSGPVARAQSTSQADLTLGHWSLPIPQPELWSPDRPWLYTVQARIESPAGTSIVERRFGLRTCAFPSHGPFLLNGQRLLLRGTHRHEDHAGVGAALTEAHLRNQIQQMKAIGVNFVRLGHYQQSDRFLDLCDEYGLLVWEEIPWCRGGLGGEGYQAQARQALTALISQHRHHPSVLVWGLGNENDWPGDFPEFDTEAIRRFMKELHDLAHRLDDRPTAIRRCDFCRDIVDVYSPSIWAGWYRGLFTDYKQVSEQEAARVDRFLHVEWGGDSHAGRHSETPASVLAALKGGQGADERAGDASLVGGEARVSRDGDWSESYICDLFDWHLKEQQTMPWLTGTAFWVFQDFATPLRPENPVPYVNQKGVVARDGTPKESYFVFQSWWTEAPMVHILGHSWPVRWGSPGEPRMVKVYSNCPEVELFVNGRSWGPKRRNADLFPAAGLWWEVTFQEGPNRLEALARSGVIEVRDALELTYQLGPGGPASQIVLRSTIEAPDLVRVFAEIVDAEGRRCVHETGRFRFGCCGDGHLVENQGTPWGSRVVQARNGRGEIRVQRPGTTVVSVHYEGLETAFLGL